MEENLKIKNNLTARYNFSEDNFNQIENCGISLEKIEEELSLFNSGIAKTFLEKPATINDGIVSLSEEEANDYAISYEKEKSKYSIEKFVPASGAASRMFKFLSEFLLEFNLETETINAYINRKNDTSLSAFIIGMDKFPFFKIIHQRLKEKNQDFDSWNRDSKNYEFIKLLLDQNEFNFANKPKGVLPFHDYENEILTPIDEHLKETIAYGNLKLHFTISGEHKSDFEKIVSKSNKKEVQITYSEQSKSTDTIAVDQENKPFKDEKNQLVFRPGGHGALIYNLNQIDSDIVFIKNIDNVSHNNMEAISIYKKALAGYLIVIQNQIFSHISFLDDVEIKKESISTIKYFIQNNLKIEIPADFNDYKIESQIKLLRTILNKPIRICGMVKNENEPGGGPFWIREKSGKVSLQIVESSQIDTQNQEQIDIFQSATHFNPVDIVCGLKNYKGEKFNLLDFIDHKSGFIVQKSKNGIAYKAYELPGLWNGAMSNWITIFVEVPLLTFNPVKTVNDLLKYNHQPQ
jgi:Domain of unknown function (DUF4301)